MSDEVRDPLNADVGDRELTKFPLLPEGTIKRFEIRKPSKATAKKSKSGQPSEMIVLPCHLAEDATSTEGQTINKGWPVYHRITVTVTEKRDARAIAGDVAKWCQAAGVKGVKVSEVIADPAKYFEGKVIDAKIRIVPESDGYPESNGLTPVIAAN